MEKTFSGKKHKSLTMRPNGALGSVKTCLYSLVRAHYSNTTCLNLLFTLSWKENILNIKQRHPVTNLPPAIFPEFHCVALSIVYTFHPTTFFQKRIIIDEKDTKQNTLQLTYFIVLAFWLKIILRTVENINICETAKGLVFCFSQTKFVTSGVQLAGPLLNLKLPDLYFFHHSVNSASNVTLKDGAFRRTKAKNTSFMQSNTNNTVINIYFFHWR